MKHRFEVYCKNYQDIENYEKALADNFKGWECHHRLETHTSDGERRAVDITVDELQALGMYRYRPASELIFLTTSEHRKLHKCSEETKKKMSEAKKNMSEETKKKMSEAKKGHTVSEETRKKMSEAKKNMSEENKNKISEAYKGCHWYNNGKINIRAKECTPGFVPGMLIRK